MADAAKAAASEEATNVQGVTASQPSSLEPTAAEAVAPWKIWAGLDSNQRRRKASRFTVCPVWPLRYLPVLAREISYILVPHSLQLAVAFAAVDSSNVTVRFLYGASARPFMGRSVSGSDFLFCGVVRVRAARFCKRSSERVWPGKI